MAGGGGEEKFYSVQLVVLTVLAVLSSELELLELSRSTCKILGGCQSEMATRDTEAVVDLLVGYNEHLWRPSAWQTPEGMTFGTYCSDLLVANSSKKQKRKHC